MKSLRILLVDDNVAIRTSFKKLLNNISNLNTVGECSDGAEVIPFLKSNEVDVIFMDIIMKVMDGFETTKKVKNNHPSIKIIGFSSSEFVTNITKMKDCGADGFISKFDATEELIMLELNKVMG